MDGYCVPGLLFGPDFVSALRARTSTLIDVHVMLARTDEWVPRLSAAGAGMLTVHRQFCADIGSTLAEIRRLNTKVGLAIELRDSIDELAGLLAIVDRAVLIATPIGIKGCEVDPSTYTRIRQLRQLRDASGHRFEIYIDGGIRRHAVPKLAEAGADGVIPGSLVFGATDPLEALRWIQLQPTGSA